MKISINLNIKTLFPPIKMEKIDGFVKEQLQLLKLERQAVLQKEEEEIRQSGKSIAVIVINTSIPNYKGSLIIFKREIPNFKMYQLSLFLFAKSKRLIC